MKAKIITLVAFTAGAMIAAAQSNPSTTNGTDLEMEMPWPNGGVYMSSYNAVNYEVVTNVHWAWPSVSYDNYNWSEGGGGTGYSVSLFWDSTYSHFWTNAYVWPGTSWPNIANGESISLPGPSGTNYDAVPPGPGIDPYIGYVNFNEYSDGGQLIIQNNQQPQITLVTGGASGTTGSELFGISATAQNDLPDSYTIPPQQINIATFGALNTNGQAFAVLPLHTQVPITPNASSGQYYEVSLNAQPYQLVSQCVSPIPPNQSRTTIGVGEQVNLSFSPTLPINAVWKTTAGTLSSITNTSTQFTAPSNATSATVTATIPGQPPIGITFNVVEPSGFDYAIITATNNFPDGIPSLTSGQSGAQMILQAFFAPTNVSFYRVSVMEVGENATNISGYFSQWTPSQLYHSTAVWVPLNQANAFNDYASGGAFPPPWSSGSFSWNIPANWQVTGSGQTNSMPGWNQVFTIDSSGTVTIQKWNRSVTRTTNSVITTD